MAKQASAWPTYVQTNPLSTLGGLSLTSLPTADSTQPNSNKNQAYCMCYSSPVPVTGAKIWGSSAVPPTITPSSNYPILNSTNATICLTVTYRSSGSFGNNLIDYAITQTDLNNASSNYPFVGAFLYLTFNNNVLG